MAGGQERVLRRRIKSVQSTKKITRAMELIAATRVVNAQERANAARPYSQQITNVILDLVGLGAEASHPLLRESSEANRSAFVVMTSDRGLCGAYNSAVIRAAERELVARQAEGKGYALILIGKKANSYFKFRNYDIAASFYDLTDRPDYEDARAVSEVVRNMFEAGDVDTVDLVYQRFLSAGSQEVVVRRFLPLETVDPNAADEPVEMHASIEFDPSPGVILDELLPRYVEARLFAALLDASAAEHAARQRAMKAATDNAEELIISLSRVMNRARQDAITGEIMEIVGGAEALHQSKGSDGPAIPAALLEPPSLVNRSA